MWDRFNPHRIQMLNWVTCNHVSAQEMDTHFDGGSSTLSVIMFSWAAVTSWGLRLRSR